MLEQLEQVIVQWVTFSRRRIINTEQKKMRAQALLTLAVLLVAVGSFSIQGQWEYQGTTDSSGQAVTLQIQDYIFRGQQILQKMIFRGCQQMLLQSQFNENQVFINPSSYLTEAIATRSCEGEANNPLDTIYAGLARVFYFQININQLVLNDPYGVTVFKFKRVVQPSTVDIVGVWTMSQYANTRTSLSVEISATQMTLCQGMAVYSYSFPATRNSILLTVVSNTCPSEQLIAAIESVRFYRLDQGVLDLYDNDIALAVEVVYSQEYDPSESIFKAAATRTSPTSMTSSSSSSASYTPSAGISSTNLSGNWSIVTLFDIPFPNTPYSLSMSLSSISLLGGCNSHTFPYTLNTTGQIITIGEGISTMKACVSDDDQLYISGIKKMYKYLISSTSSGFSLNFYAESGQIGYALEIKNAIASVQSQDLAFGEGVVLMLLLGRRDLARAVVRINGSSLSYTGCNTITHGFTVSDQTAAQGSIQMVTRSATEKACPGSNDSLYEAALNSAVSYTYNSGAKTVIFKDASGNEVVTFNRT